MGGEIERILNVDRLKVMLFVPPCSPLFCLLFCRKKKRTRSLWIRSMPYGVRQRVATRCVSSFFCICNSCNVPNSGWPKVSAQILCIHRNLVCCHSARCSLCPLFDLVSC